MTGFRAPELIGVASSCSISGVDHGCARAERRLRQPDGDDLGAGAEPEVPLWKAIEGGHGADQTSRDLVAPVMDL